MNSYKLFIEINSNYVSLFAGYIYGQEIFTLDFIERDLQYDLNENYYKFDDATINIINDMLKKLENDIQINFQEASIIINSPNVVANSNNKVLSVKEFTMNKNFSKSLYSFILDSDKYDGFQNICLDNVILHSNGMVIDNFMKLKNFNVFNVNYNIYRIDRDYYTKIKNLERSLNIKISNIYPANVCKMNLIKTLTNIHSFNICDFDMMVSYLSKVENGAITNISKLSTSLFDLKKNIMDVFKIDSEKTDFLINHYGLCNSFIYNIQVMENIHLDDLNNMLVPFYKSLFDELKKYLNQNEGTTYFFGDGVHFPHFIDLIAENDLQRCKVFKLDILGARNYHSYSSLGALILQKNSNLYENDKSDHILRGDL